MDCFDTVFGIKIKESLWGFIRGWFCSFSKSFQVEGILVPGCSLEFLEIAVLFFCVGPVIVCVSLSQTQSSISVTNVASHVSLRSDLRNFSGRAASLRKSKRSDLFVHHMDKAFGFFAGRYDCQDRSQFFGLVEFSKNREFILHFKIVK